MTKPRKPSGEKWGRREWATWLRQHHGLSEEDARAIAYGLHKKIRDILLADGRVAIHQVGSIHARKLPAGRYRVAGIIRDLPERTALRITTSRKLR